MLSLALQSYQSLASPSVFTDLPTIAVRPLPYFEDVSEAVSNLREKLEGILKREWCRISTRGRLESRVPSAYFDDIGVLAYTALYCLIITLFHCA